jgi:hypothetical protein
MSEADFREIVDSLAKNIGYDRPIRTLARQLLFRINGTMVLEDAISNTQGDFASAAAAAKDISRREMPFGILLESLITHPDLVDKLAENPTSLQNPPALFANANAPVSHDEFIAFLRAFIGISCVLAVYAWADSMPDEHCRERSLGVLRLWQGVDGYREVRARAYSPFAGILTVVKILDHLLLMRQMVFRLGCMLDTDVPTRAGIDSEAILLKLSKYPQAMMRPYFTECILSLKPPHSLITHEEQDSMQGAAYIADNGLLGVVDFLLQPIEQSPSFSYLRSLRVALATVDQELADRDEYEILQEFWKEGSRSLETCLVDTFTSLSDEICNYFSVEPPPVMSLELLSYMFKSVHETMTILARLFSAYPLPGRALRAFTIAAANLFVCTDVADILFSQTSPVCVAAQEVRQSSVAVIRSLAEILEPLPEGKSNAQVVLRTLLEHGLRSGSHEPVHHLLQVFCLVDYLLPTPEQDTLVAWGQNILPSILREIWAFCRALDTENKAHFVRRLVALDQGIVGVGDWLIMEELKDLTSCLQILEDPSTPPHILLAVKSGISMSLRFLLDLMAGASSEVASYADSLGSNPALAQPFAAFLQFVLAENVSSTHLTKILRILASGSTTFQVMLKLPLALALLRTSQHQGASASEVTSSLYLAHSIFLTCPNHLVLATQISIEISHMLAWLKSSSFLTEGDLPVALVGLLEWFISTDDPTLLSFTHESFSELCAQLKPSLDSEKQEAMNRTMDSLRFSKDSPAVGPSTLLPDTIELSVEDMEDLLKPKEAMLPSTPLRKQLNQDVLSLVAISPPTALIRSSASTGLTKTYMNNDFRQLRQTPSARQNTSRLPSMHVDVGSTS